MDMWFVGDSQGLEGTGTNLNSLCGDIIVAVKDEEAFLTAHHCMVDVERLVAAVAFRRELERNKSEAQPEAVAEFFL